MSRYSRIILALFLTLFVSGCQSVSSLSTPKITHTLPKPENLKVLSSSNAIALEWEYKNTTDVEGYRVYRSASSGKMEAIATLDDRFTSHFVDQNLQPDHAYNYTVCSIGTDSAQSEASTMATAKTLPPFEPVSFIAGVNSLPNRAKIVWRPHVNMGVNEYSVQRYNNSKSAWEEAGTASHRLQPEFIDKKVESGQNYRYRIVAKAFDGTYSRPSEEANVSTKRLPHPPPSITASKDQPKQIEVKWQPTDEKVFDSYRLYSAKIVDGSFDVIAKTDQTSFIDKIDEDGAVRYYKVTTIDRDGLESLFQVAASGQTRPLPLTPSFTLATIRENKVVLGWVSSDKSVVKYRITRKTGKFFARDTLVINDIADTQFIDKDVDLGVKYLYGIEAIDKDGLASKPSDEVELFVPKGI